jgi:hypothetical protein
MAGEATANNKDAAISLIRQAELMESDAHNMRLKAYKMDPSLAQKIKKPSNAIESLGPKVPVVESVAPAVKKPVAKKPKVA